MTEAERAAIRRMFMLDARTIVPIVERVDALAVLRPSCPQLWWRPVYD